MRRLAMLLLMVWVLPVKGEITVQTPLERNHYEKLSSHADLMAYLKTLDAQSEILSMSKIGQSVSGRDIPVLFFSTDQRFASRREQKLLVLIYCQQHGNEPSGKEAALVLARDLVNRDRDLLNNLDLMLVPQVNPDGSENGKRRNGNSMDLNRNHVMLSEPESLALHTLFLRWMPEVTLDVHEFNASSKRWFTNGYMKDAEEMFDCVSNLNIAPDIVQLSASVLIPEAGRLIQEDGFRFHRYIVGGPPANARIRHSTTNVNDGRNSMGIYNTFSFIFEGKRFSDLVTNIQRRTAGQVSALKAFLKTMSAHRSEIRKMVHESREKLLAPSQPQDDTVYIQMDYFPDPQRKTITYPVFDLSRWQHTQRQLDHYEPLVRVKKSVRRPFAYLFPEQETRLVEVLSRHQIEIHRLMTDTEMEVESYTIADVVPIVEEDKPGEDVRVNTTTTTRRMKRGSMVVFLKQRAANLIPLLLEPQSSWGLCTERSGRRYRFSEYLKKGQPYPILRVIKPVTLDVKPME